jgi:general stress protein 26
MADRAADRPVGIPTSVEKDLDGLYGLIDGIGIAMFTTRREDGHLVSRPMAVQDRSKLADLWFVTDIETHKLGELMHDPHVNCAFYRDRTREWVSVSGTGRVVGDRAMIRELYRPDWKAWFGDEGGARDGGPDDPRIALIAVDAESVTYLKLDKPRPVVLFEVLKGIATGTPPDVGEVRQVSGDELR